MYLNFLFKSHVLLTWHLNKPKHKYNTLVHKYNTLVHKYNTLFSKTNCYIHDSLHIALSIATS